MSEQYEVRCEKCDAVYRMTTEFNQCSGPGRMCDPCKAKRDKRNQARRARHQAMLDLGLVRVKGSMGGTYYE